MESLYTYHDLEKDLGFSKSIPVTEKWSAAADFLKIVSDYCLEKKPGVIVECSSGTSSIALAQCCRLNNCGKVFSLENGENYSQKTAAEINVHELEKFCDVIFSPLKDYDINGGKYQWYELGELPVKQIDLLVVDGPPGFIQKNSRYPALPLLHDLLADECAVFLDDAARDDEKEIVDAWLLAFPSFKSEYIETERGCAVLTRNQAEAL